MSKIKEITLKELHEMIMERVKMVREGLTPQMIIEAAKRLDEMPSYRTAMRARDSALKDMHTSMNVGDTEGITKRLHQANRFDTYGENILNSIIGTKVQIITDDKSSYSYSRFYIGKITKVDRELTNTYRLHFKGVNEYDPNDVIEDSFTISPLDSYSNNYNTLQGETDSGLEVQIKLSNKRARLAIGTLLNRDGGNNYMKPIR